jgi:hypothetical protein
MTRISAAVKQKRPARSTWHPITPGPAPQPAILTTAEATGAA